MKPSGARAGEVERPRQVSLVTGAGSGIGRAVAVALLAEGHGVVITGRRLEALRETAAEAGAPGGAAIPIAAHVRDPDAVSALFGELRERCGRLDLLFNNAGLFGPTAAIEDYPAADWTAVIETNLTGPFLCAREAFRLMKEQRPRGGRIINNGSLSAQTPRPHAVAYTASKHAVTGLTRALALEGRDHDIACGQIDIGNAATAMTRQLGAGALQPDGSTAAEPLFDVTEVVRTVVHISRLPLDVNMSSLTMMATRMPFAGRG